MTDLPPFAEEPLGRSGTNEASTSESPVARAPMRRLDPASFPHPPRPGSGLIPTTIENVRHLIDSAGFRPYFDVIKKKMGIEHADGSRASMTEILSVGALHNLDRGLTQTFAEEIAHQRPYNPVLEWIDSRSWDGVDRLPSLYATVKAQTDYPLSLKDIILRRWFLSVVAAVKHPDNFQTRGVLTLQGSQGVGKTRWIGSLVPAGRQRDQWVKRDHNMDGLSEDSIIGAISHWIVEIGELDGAFKRDVSRLKGFLTNDCDKLRRPYGHDEVEYPRCTVFAATVNDTKFLVDPTGNNRWLTIAVEALDHNHTIDMQQVYAQLAIDVRAGEQWWLTDAENIMLESYNSKHRVVSAIHERVIENVDVQASRRGEGQYMTAMQFLTDIGVRYPTNAQCKECGAAFRELLGQPKRVHGRDQWRIQMSSNERVYTSIR
ncbi:VapE domain-containing protein [Sphingoaurantiacus capsulatus]|uniref:VapE domain-containing protein n=1 Tax=Sphingoaurantiacus capsulatus TaxID=1771310 RepID=A0ABV7XDP8_9SPHN